MSPSRAGSSHSSSWRFFSSARLGSWPFLLQLGFENWPKTSWKLFIINLFWKWLNYVLLCHINSDKWLWIDWIHDTEAKIWKKMLLNNVHWKICYLIKYILSARFQLGNWSAPARLGSARNLCSSARLELENSGSGSSLIVLHTRGPLKFWFGRY